jgi:hypothetical protein
MMALTLKPGERVWNTGHDRLLTVKAMGQSIEWPEYFWITWEETAWLSEYHVETQLRREKGRWCI